MADALADAWLRVVVAETPRAGLADAVREILPGALDVDIDERFRPTSARRRGPDNAGRVRSARELFRDYLTETGRNDERVGALFDRLHDEVTRDVGGNGGVS